MVKRLFDLCLATFLLVLFLPVLAIVAWQVRKKIGGSALFFQQRPGFNGKIFRLVKFRTMIDAFDTNGDPLSDAERMTEFGSFLRRSSLDELPELWNVLKGEMSFVGPRPLLVEYLPLYSANQARRHEVRPGITGWAQVNGRNSLSWKEKFKLDVWYIDNRSIWLDFKILMMTARAVFSQVGVAAEGSVTAEKFRGE